MATAAPLHGRIVNFSPFPFTKKFSKFGLFRDKFLKPKEWGTNLEIFKDTKNCICYLVGAVSQRKMTRKYAQKMNVK